MFREVTLKTKILATLFVGAFIGITTICGFWLHNEYILNDRQLRQQVNNQKRNAVEHLSEKLHHMIQVSEIVGHSLSLRRYIIDANQSLMRASKGNREAHIETEAARWRSLDETSETFKSIWNSLEADYLRSMMDSSDNIIDTITVTDAFGFVRVSTHVPEQTYVFEEEWWRRALQMKSNQVYQYTMPPENQLNYVYLSLPLYNDEGVDSVGVVQLRLRLDHLFAAVRQATDPQDPPTVFVTDQHTIFPPQRPRSPFSIGEIIAFSGQPPDLYTDKEALYLVGIETLSGRIRQVYPDMTWSVIAYRPRTQVISFKNPVFQKALISWLIGIGILSMLSYLVSLWIIDPIRTIIKAVRNIADGNFGVRLPEMGQGEIAELSSAVNSLAETSQQQSSGVARTLRETNASLTAFEDFTQEAALEHDRRIISDSLLRLAVRKMNADAGVLQIHNPDYKTPMTIKYNLTDTQIQAFSSLAVHGVNSKTVFFAWDNPEHKAIWDDGYQVLFATPIRTRHSRFGTLYLMFYQAIDSDFVKDRTIELMAQQGAVYMSRSALFHQLDRQISFTEGILAGIPWFICTLDAQMHITWHNNRLGDLNLKTIENLIGTRCCQTFKGRDTICPDCPARQTLNDGEQHEINQRWIMDNGDIRWIRVNSFPSKDETGQMRSVILFLRDITSETQAQAEIRQLAQAIDSIGEAVVFTDMNRQIVSVNKAFERIFNYKAPDIRNSTIDILFPIENQRVTDEITATIRHDKIWSREMELIKHNDDRIMCTLVVSLVRDNAGLPVGHVYTCFDISRRINREKKMIQHYRELEILHTLSQVLSKNIAFTDMLQEILDHVTKFAGCPSGAILLFKIEDAPQPTTDDILVNTDRPDVYQEKELPGFFLKYIEELRQGRRSELFSRCIRTNEPVILNKIQTAGSVEETLVRRMGFHSMQVLPIRASGKDIGLIFMFSPSSYHFNPDQRDIYRSIAAQIGVSIYGRYLQNHLMNRARYQISGEVATRIGGDVNQVLQVVELARHAVETAIQNRSWDALSQGWMNMSRHIWQLYNITLNALSLSAEDERLYFPEDLLSTLSRSVDQLRGQSFADRLEITLNTPDEIPEVYFNKLTLQRALANLLILAVDACWFMEHPRIDVTVHGTTGSGDSYAIEIAYTSDRLSPLEHAMETYRDTRSVSDLPVLLSGAIKAIKSHGGSLFFLFSKEDSVRTLRMIMPRYPGKH